MFLLYYYIMGKVEIGIYFCVTTDILTNVLLKCFLGSPLPTIWILSKSLILIGCHGNRKAKFSTKKYIQKSFFSEAIRGMKLKLCINVHDISLYINCIFFVSLLMCFRCYGNSNIPYTCSYNGKSGNWHLFLCYCRYFDKSFTEMFLE